MSRRTQTTFAAPSAVPWALAAVFVALELAVITRYGYFRDELYYLASTRHLDWGYVEHPPLSIAILAGWTALFGDSLWALRLLPALAGAAVVLVTARLARALGGGAWAQGMAALAVLAAPEFLGGHHVYSMNAFDKLFWALAAYVWLAGLERNERHSWLALGVILGLGLLNKLSVLWLIAGMFVAMLVGARRGLLATPGPWITALIAAAFLAPHVVWQVTHGWPVREFMHNATQRKMVPVNPLEFFVQQVLNMNPASAVIWIGALVACLLLPSFSRARELGVAFVVVFTILALNRASRASYLAPAFPLLFAPGAVALESWLARRSLRGLRPVLAGAIVVFAVIALPLALPVLSPQAYVRYTAAIGFQPRQEEHQARTPLPQQYADMFGWDEMAQTVARVYRALPPEEQAGCVVFGQNYGEAGAIDVLGRHLGLPRALSGHNSYWLWGPGNWDGRTMIVIGSNAADNGEFFESVEQVATIHSDYSVAYERDLPVFVCRRFKGSVAAAWPRLKLYI